jgi:hypothetical protein
MSDLSRRDDPTMKAEEDPPNEPPRSPPQASTGKFFRRDLRRPSQHPPVLPEHLTTAEAAGEPPAAAG